MRIFALLEELSRYTVHMLWTRLSRIGSGAYFVLVKSAYQNPKRAPFFYCGVARDTWVTQAATALKASRFHS